MKDILPPTVRGRPHQPRFASFPLRRALLMLTLCVPVGTASAGGREAPPLPAAVLGSLSLQDVCIGEGVSVTSSEALPNTFLQSYSEMMYDIDARHREELSFRGGQAGKCKVYTHIALEFIGKEPRLPYALNLRLLRDPWSSANPGVVWESGAAGIADWHRTHP